MIIASPAKKELAIPLQNLTKSTSRECLRIPNEHSQKKEDDVVTITPRNKAVSDLVSQLFGQGSSVHGQVNEIMTISTTVAKSNKIGCQAFIHNNTVFLSCPIFGKNAGLLNWADGEFQSCVTRLIELAEEKTGCGALVVAIDRRNQENVNTILRAFLYLGFEVVNPSVYNQDPGFIFVGYEL
ncbi:uncharacterized protein BYT42DRAFT_616506 [Radiomyces spectabilis]|uniref:uncharacterized protein n=1 Tax=Radiomyces spectabilis TaxID=64574 RepID=UPI0022212625|nr:uncharacterized protein BYT42DRAFT_616506 [Radiomyces spectabilis]KAI8371412.1 hypothetical protein BYT42DRAFT_616506 [Radiomyces spectabilis]